MSQHYIFSGVPGGSFMQSSVGPMHSLMGTDNAIPGLQQTYIAVSSSPMLTPEYRAMENMQSLHMTNFNPQPTMTASQQAFPSHNQAGAFVDASGNPTYNKVLHPGQGLLPPGVQVRPVVAMNKPRPPQMQQMSQLLPGAATPAQMIALRKALDLYAQQPQAGARPPVVSQAAFASATNAPVQRAAVVPTQCTYLQNPNNVATVAAAAAALAATNQVAQNRRTIIGAQNMVPIQHSGAMNMGMPTGVRPVLPGGAAVRPVATPMTVVQPAASVFAAPGMVRPALRVPKMGTVSTYNPATGMRTRPYPVNVNGGTGAVNGSQSNVAQLSASTTSLANAVASAAANRVALPQSSQLLQQLTNAGIAPQRLVNLQALQAAQRQNNLNTTTFSQSQLAALGKALSRDNSGQLAALQQSILNGLLGGNGTLKGASNVGVDSGDASRSTDSQAALLNARSQQQQQQQNEQQTLQAAHSAALKTLAADQHAKSAGGNGFISRQSTLKSNGLAEMGAASTLLSNTENLVSGDTMPVTPEASDVEGKTGIKGLVQVNNNTNKEDLKMILACIGVELARHGIRVDSALSAGWLGVLSGADVSVLKDAYYEEEKRMKDLQGQGFCIDQSVKVAATKTSPGSPEPSLPVDQLSNGDDLREGTEPVAFDAFKYGFFGDVGGPQGELLEELELDEGDVQIAQSWGSAGEDPAEVEGEGAEAAAVDSNSEALDLSAHLSVLNGLGKEEISSRFANLDLGCGFL